MYPITLHADTNEQLERYVARLRNEDAPDVPFSLGHHVTEDQARDYDRHRFVTLSEDGEVLGMGELVSPEWWARQPDDHKGTYNGQKKVLRNGGTRGTILAPVVVGEKSGDLNAHPLLDYTPTA